MSLTSEPGNAALPEHLPIERDPIRWALRENNQDWYRELVEHSRDLLCVHDLQGHLLSVNPVPARLLGYTVEEMLRIPMREMIVPEYRDLFDLYLRQIESDGAAQGLMVVLSRSSERQVWEFQNTLHTARPGAPVVLGLAHDITEKRQAEAKFQALLEAAPDAMVVVDAEARMMLVNAQAERMFGYQREELLGQRIEMLVPERLRELHCELRNDFFDAPQHMPTGVAREFLALHKSGHEFPVEINLSPLQTSEGLLVTSAIRDITERKRAGELLRKSEERLRLAQEVAKIGTFERNLQTGDCRWSPEMEVMYGLEPGETPKSFDSFLQLVHPADRTHVEHLIAESIEAGQTEGEWRVIWPDGTIHWITGKWKIFKDEQGRPLRAIGIDFDTTERKHAEEALRGSEAELREAQRVAHMGSWRLNLKSQAVTWSEQIYRELRLDPSSLAPTFSELTRVLTPESFQDLVQSMEKVTRSRQPEEVEVGFHRADGSTGWALLRGEIDCDETGNINGLHGIALDITSRKQAEERLREYEKALEGLEEMIVVVDREYRYVIANRAFLKYRQMEREQLAGRLISEVLTKGVFETIVKPKLDDCFQGRVIKYETRYTYPHLGERDLLISYLPVEGETGIERVACVLQDITERKQAEARLQRLVEELRLAQEKLSEEKVYLEQEIDTELGFEEIIGESPAVKKVMEQVGKVAASDATVLLLGETGTGKELVARALHRLSGRASNSFIKMNCAAVPSGLLESELFGYEKGAFTGAVGKKAGRLELADKGTLFLDEIGEIPLALQPKLLRVLQDQEFERLGGTQTLKVDSV